MGDRAGADLAAARGVAFPRLDRRALWAALLAGGVGWSLLRAGAGGELVNEGGWVLVARFFQAALRPALDAELVRLALHAGLVTLAFAVCGTALSLVLGVAGGLLASEVWWRSVLPSAAAGARRGRHRVPWVAVRALLAVPRAIHEVVWGLLLLNVLGLDPIVGVLAIAIPFGAITAKVFSEILDESPREPLTALLGSGVPPLRAHLYAAVPQALPDLLSYAFYRFECSIRSAAVLGIIGAGGLGYEILLSFQTLRYEEMWTFLLALMLLTGATDLWSGLVRRRLGSPHRIDIRIEERAGGGVPRRTADGVLRGSLVAGAALLAFSFWYTAPHFGRLWEPRTAGLLADLARRAWPPGLGGIGLGTMLAHCGGTLAMSLLAIAGASLGGMLLSYPAANNFLLPGGILGARGSTRWSSILGAVAFGASRAALLVFRAVPAPIWALVLLFVLFPGILPGAVALGVYTMGVLGRLMAEVTENLDRRPLQALRAQGASGPQVFLYGVLPATLPRHVSYLLYRWEVAIRATAMVGLVGAGGLGRVLSEQLSSFDYRGVAATVLFYVGLTFLVDLLSAAARRDLR